MRSTEAERREFGLDKLEHEQLVHSLRNIIGDDELVAQLEELSDDEEECGLPDAAPTPTGGARGPRPPARAAGARARSGGAEGEDIELAEFAEQLKVARAAVISGVTKSLHARWRR